eukprot:jgi/Bigna1/136147/aug1.32_g10855
MTMHHRRESPSCSANGIKSVFFDGRGSQYHSFNELSYSVTSSRDTSFPSLSPIAGTGSPSASPAVQSSSPTGAPSSTSSANPGTETGTPSTSPIAGTASPSASPFVQSSNRTGAPSSTPSVSPSSTSFNPTGTPTSSFRTHVFSYKVSSLSYLEAQALVEDLNTNLENVFPTEMINTYTITASTPARAGRFQQYPSPAPTSPTPRPATFQPTVEEGTDPSVTSVQAVRLICTFSAIDYTTWREIEQIQFEANFKSALASSARVLVSAVIILGYSLGSTVVESEIRTSNTSTAERMANVARVSPQNIFNTSNGFDTSTYGQPQVVATIVRVTRSPSASPSTRSPSASPSTRSPSASPSTIVTLAESGSDAGQSGGGSGFDFAVVIGGVIGAIIVIAVISASYYRCCYTRRSSQKEQATIGMQAPASIELQSKGSPAAGHTVSGKVLSTTWGQQNDLRVAI